MKNTQKLYDLAENLKLEHQVAAYHNVIGFVETILENHLELHIDPKYKNEDVSWGLRLPIIDSTGAKFFINCNFYGWTPKDCKVKIVSERIQLYKMASFPVEVDDCGMNAINHTPGKLYNNFLRRFYNPWKEQLVITLEKMEDYKAGVEIGRAKIDQLIDLAIWVPGMKESKSRFRGNDSFMDPQRRNERVDLHFVSNEVSVGIEAYPSKDGSCSVKVSGDINRVLEYLKAWTVEGVQSELLRMDVEA